MAKNLEGRVAIVTGAARGLGEAAARALAQRGAAVLMTDVLADVGESAAQALRSEGYQAAFCLHDVADPQQWNDAWEAAVERFGAVDILVNNAGVYTPRTIEEITLDEYRRVVEINLFGSFTGMQLAVKYMKESGGGAIINLASNTTAATTKFAAGYSPTKAAVANLTKVVALHCAQERYGIRVNSVHPGACDTVMANQGMDAELKRQFEEMNPMGRFGRPMEVGNAVAFLASDDSSFITGAELFVDGGATLSQV